MHDQIKVTIDPDSCTCFSINPEKYKEKLHLAFLVLPYGIEVIIDRSHSVSDGVFPLALSMLTGASHNQRSQALAEIQLTPLTVFQELAIVNA